MSTLTSDMGGKWPRLLKRADAATYVSLGLTKFDQMVKDGRMPRPKQIDGRVAWDRNALDAAIDDLPEQAEQSTVNPWDALLS